jgi:hypothetical protein
MTNEELLSVAEIVERATNRLHRQAAEHEAKMAEHRASFGARTDADAKLIAGLREERNGLLTQVQDMRAEIERLKKPARQHPVKVGEYVKNDNGDVCQVHEVYAEYLLNTGWTWAFENCTPCDPPTASHDTPAGKETAQAAAEPKPGDVVRLVRVPTNDEYPHDSGRWEPNWGGIGDYMRVHYVGSNINGTRVVRAVFGLEWPLSCVEVVKGATSEHCRRG